MNSHLNNTNLFYCNSITKFSRRKTSTVKVGDLYLGSDFPIRVQSMTTTDTMDTQKSVEQIKRMVDAGCELVRLTAPSINEANNLAAIKAEMNKQGIFVPLVADIHFTPNAAEAAARIVEKVRINPGNYADKKKFEEIEYTDASYNEELERIREKFIPLVRICKEYGTAMRIGTNHGSLSDRIMSRYGDSPLGMVESAMEFLRICEEEKYHNIVLSMKSSNPQVMIEAYRLLVNTMDKCNMHYPLHLGVTEAGDGNDGRIKSALGIGALLEDGIGDTIRVSLTEDPEFEVPVAQKLVARYAQRSQSITVPFALTDENILSTFNPFQYTKRLSNESLNIGGPNVPRVIADFSNKAKITPESLRGVGYDFDAVTDKWHMNDLGVDYVFVGNNDIDFMLPSGLKGIYPIDKWLFLTDKQNNYPLLTYKEFNEQKVYAKTLNFLSVSTAELDEMLFNKLATFTNWVLILKPSSELSVSDFNNAFVRISKAGLKLPVILHQTIEIADPESLMLYASTDLGTPFINGFGDGIMISSTLNDKKLINDISFGILQAARARVTKTEYISCPSCGRTLFDLQETTALIRKHTDHLKGVKIAIMGCIVNGPGEMADADYGYVGSGPGKITLYKGKEVVKKGVNKETAVDELINIIKADGNWMEVSR